jgi:hypothetical protein
MAVPQALPHIDAVTTALTAAQLTAYLGGAPQGVTPPYIVLYPSPGAPVRASLADDRVNWQSVVQLTCVGATAEQALNVADRARAALDPPLAVAGRTGWRPEALDGQPVTRDDDVTPPVYYAVARWRLRSTPS